MAIVVVLFAAGCIGIVPPASTESAAVWSIQRDGHPNEFSSTVLLEDLRVTYADGVQRGAVAVASVLNRSPMDPIETLEFIAKDGSTASTTQCRLRETLDCTGSLVAVDYDDLPIAYLGSLWIGSSLRHSDGETAIMSRQGDEIRFSLRSATIPLCHSSNGTFLAGRGLVQSCSGSSTALLERGVLPPSLSDVSRAAPASSGASEVRGLLPAESDQGYAALPSPESVIDRAKGASKDLAALLEAEPEARLAKLSVSRQEVSPGATNLLERETIQFKATIVAPGDRAFRVEGRFGQDILGRATTRIDAQGSTTSVYPKRLSSVGFSTAMRGASAFHLSEAGYGIHLTSWNETTATWYFVFQLPHPESPDAVELTPIVIVPGTLGRVAGAQLTPAQFKAFVNLPAKAS